MDGHQLIRKILENGKKIDTVYTYYRPWLGSDDDEDDEDNYEPLSVEDFIEQFGSSLIRTYRIINLDEKECNLYVIVDEEILLI